VEAACAEALHTATAFAQEVVTAWERNEVSIKEATVHATLAEREAQERVLKAVIEPPQK
jgi:hypothetical protein